VSNRPIWLFPAIATAVAIGLGAALLIASNGRESVGGDGRAAPVRMSGEAQIGGPFTLVNHLGETVTEADFLGRPMLIYFGFTYCPDICPTSLQVLAAALDRLPEDQRDQFQTLLISVDPERDTPDSLAQYVDSPAFPANLMGLTGRRASARCGAGLSGVLPAGRG
jgi:cytochrome oxidase Cu insertion factor (SCO1/SenC/PrrC family)